jgi:hypothetical protein
MKKYLTVAVAAALTTATTSALLLVPAQTIAGASTPTSLTGLDAAQVLNVSLKAASTEHSASVVLTTQVGTNTVRQVITSGPRSGYATEDVVGHKGQYIYVHGVLYVKFDATLLHFMFGVSDNAVANKWISSTKGDKYYANMSEDLTLPSMLQVLHPSGTLALTAPTTINATSVIGVYGGLGGGFGTLQGNETLYVSAVAPYLPVQLVVNYTTAGTHVITLVTPKNWGVPVSVDAPTVFTSIKKTSLPH